MTSFPSSSRCSGTMRSSIGWPTASAPGSLSVSRVMTRTPSGSSTTPTPKGTSPRYPGGGAVTAVQAHNVPGRDSSTGSGSSVAQ